MAEHHSAQHYFVVGVRLEGLNSSESKPGHQLLGRLSDACLGTPLLTPGFSSYVAVAPKNHHLGCATAYINPVHAHRLCAYFLGEILRYCKFDNFLQFIPAVLGGR